ncbi:MAG: hypothetical protein ACOYMF_12475 [Bacteroidales bacterium]
MAISLDDLILQRLDELIKVIDALPYSINVRTIIKYLVATDFQDSWQFDDKENPISYKKYLSDPENPEYRQIKTTQGIQNLPQLTRYIHEFITELKHVSSKILESIFFSEDFKFIDFSPNKGVNFREITRFTFLYKYKLNFITEAELDRQIKSMLGPDFPYHLNERARKYQLPDHVNIVSEILQKADQVIYMVDELENSLCIHAANYHYEAQKLNLRLDHDPDHFTNFVSSTLYDQFNKRMTEKIVRLPRDNAIRYLTISINQFLSHDPGQRIDAICDRFWRSYHFPEIPPPVMDEAYFRYLTPAITAYKMQFDKFRVATEKALADYTKNTSSSDPEKEKTLNEMIDATVIYDQLYRKKEESNAFEFNDYYNKWLNCSVTLSEWEQHVGLEMIYILKQFPLSEDDWNRIRKHQLFLYNQYVENLFNSHYKPKFDLIKSDKDKILIANRDIALINDLISGDINEHKESLLKSFFSIFFWLATSMQLDDILRNRITSDNNHDIHHTDCYANAEAILKYKDQLAEFLNPYSLTLDLADMSLDLPQPVPKVEQSKNTMSKQEMEGYFQDWITGRTTLSQWIAYKDSKVLNNIYSLGQCEDDYYDIMGHQMHLFNEYVVLLSNRFIERINSKSDDFQKHFHANKDLALIDDLINGNINSVKAKLLYNSFSINDSEKTCEQISEIIEGIDDPTSYIDIHLPDCNALAEAILRYKKYLNTFLESTPSSVPDKRTSDSSINNVPPTKRNSYKYKRYTGNFSAISDMLNSLKDSKFVHQNVKIQDFRKLFNNSVVTVPIIWTGYKTDLSYFVRLLNLEYQFIDNLDKDIWKVTAQLFVDVDHKPFIAAKLHGQKKPARANLLRNAVECLK